MKVATIPTEVEAIDSVLMSHTAQNVPKRAKQRNMNVPVGPMRYDPSSSAWIEILEETEAKKKKVIENKQAKEEEQLRKHLLPKK